MEITARQKELIETEAVAVATINADGSPNVIPVGDVRVVGVSSLIITDNFMRQTSQNIKQNPQVCLAVWTKDWEEGYKFIGKAKYHSTGKWAKYVKDMKENNGFPAKGAIVVTVEKSIKLG